MSTETLPTTAGGFPARARRFYLDVLGEMRKVTWPTRDEVRKATLAIIVFVGILGAAIGLMDTVFQAVLVKLVARLF